jgi:formylglycine-generating enzyme required for sulfatase activity
MTKLLLAATAMACLCLSFTKEKPFTPPGTVQINDTLFADETEITNFSWQEYEYWNKAIYGVNSKEHLATLPDTLVWREKNSYNEPYVQYYYRHPAYKEFPVVGVSYEQAVAFCKWRTERVKMFLTRKKDFKNHNFEYRLPSKEEWEQLAYSSSSVLFNNGKDEKGMRRLNCVHMDTFVVKGKAHHSSDVTAPVYSYWKNFIGLYNMLGNVAEMVNEKGISKGGGWRNNLEECRVGKDAGYTKPTAWLGFRCVCVVKKGNS